MVPLISPTPVPTPETVNVNVSGLDTPRIVNVPGMSNVVSSGCDYLKSKITLTELAEKS